MILFHVRNLNERWSYTLDFVLALRGINYKLTSSQEEFSESTLTKISFSDWNIGGLLDEIGLTKKNISKGNWQTEECLTFNEIPDPLSSLFFVLSRMEEYYPRKRDAHNRFSGKDSVQNQYNWLDKCICDRWALSIIKKIEKKIGVSLQVKTTETAIIPTFDIDNAYAYQLKRGKRKLLSISKDVLQRNFVRLKERKDVLANIKKDPYDTYDLIESIAQKFPVKIFWLVGDYGQYDKNIKLENPGLQELIRRLDQMSEIGIHPSYISNSIPAMVKTEKERLEAVVGKKIISSRQHFLKISFPQTYRNLILYGIKEDFTMGFADTLGFRNGTAHAFPWFDILENRKTDLIIRPFAYMDGTLNEYLQLSNEEACTRILSLYNEVLQFGGDFVFLWHNETIGNSGKWKDWTKVLDYTLSLKLKERT